MKKKKTDILIKKAQKRYTKLQLFLKKLIPCTIAVLSVFLIITAILLRSMILEMSMSFNDICSIIETKINNAYEKKLENNDNSDSDIMYYLCSYFTYNSPDNFAVIYDSETGQIVYTSEKNVFAFLYVSNKTMIYRCADEVLDNVLNLTQKYQKDNNYMINNHDYYLSYRLMKAYIKDDIFIPVSFDVVKISYDNNQEEEKIDTINIDTGTPDGYIYYDFENRVNMYIEGTDYDDNAKDYMKQQVIKSSRRTSTTLNQNKINILGDNYFCETSFVNTLNDKDYEIIFYNKFNAVDGNSKYYIIDILYVLGISAFISWLLALKKYYELSSHYALEDYRRELTNTLAHDLKSPLTVISGCAENIRCGTNPEKNDHYSDSIIENVSYMDSIISNVLDLSKLESGTVELRKTSIDLKELTDEIIKKYETVISEKFLTIKINGSVTIKADRNMISHAFENLLTNAIKYSELSGQISIEITDDEYTISNHHSSLLQITEDDLCRPFVKGDESRSGKNGSGLGLSIVKNITEAHGYSLVLNYTKEDFVAKIVFKKT